jgi:hypothetical protein
VADCGAGAACGARTADRGGTRLTSRPASRTSRRPGITSPAAIAAELNRLGIPVAAGLSDWRPAQVAWVLHQLRWRRAPYQDPVNSGADEMTRKAVATPQARTAGGQAGRAQADVRAAALAPVIAEIRASGVTTPYAIAAALTARGIPTQRGHRFWLAGPVRSLLARLDRLSADGALGLQIESRESPRPGKPTSSLLQRERLC